MNGICSESWRVGAFNFCSNSDSLTRAGAFCRAEPDVGVVG